MMTGVWRRLQQSTKKSAKYRFTITPQELIVVGSAKWQPQNVALACMHRRRRVEGRVRKCEGSMTDPCRSLIVWPSQTPDPLLFDTTLYCNDSTTHYIDKEWTLVVEECTRKGRRKAIAAINLNMPLFVQSSDGVAEVKLKLRPLWPELVQCSLQVLIASVLLTEEETNNLDAKSETSSINGGQRASIAGDLEAEQRTNSARVDNVMVTSYSVNLNDIERRKTRDEEKRVELMPKTEGSAKSNGISSLREKFFEQNHSDSVVQQRLKAPQQKVQNVIAQKKPVPTKAIEEPQPEKNGFYDIYREPLKIDKSQDVSESSESAKVDAIDAAFPAKASDEIPKVKLDKEAETLPAVVEGEDLLTWCQRVTKNYPSVKIADFTKSFRSGLAFCAIIHRYRPDLIGPFNKLDFADSHSSHHENCRKAFDAATLIGVQKKLDAGMTITLPDRSEIQCFLSELRMHLVDVSAITREMSIKGSDHRISALFNLSESETSVMKELEILRRQRERDEAIDLTNIPDVDCAEFIPVVSGVQKTDNRKSQRRARKLANPFDSESDSDGASKCTAQISVVAPPSSSSAGTDGHCDPDSICALPISPMVAVRHEELTKKRQQLAAISPLNTDSVDTAERDRRYREEARRLMNDAASDGATLLLGGSAPTTAHQSPAVATTSDLLRKLSSGEDAGRCSLRKLEVVTPAVEIYKFKKIQPSPNFHHKKYETPVIAPCSRSTQRLSNSNADIRKNSLGVTLDRAKRYGSMRGQELVETVAKVAGRAFTSSLVAAEDPVSATPTRKLICQWEEDGADLAKIQAELNRLSKRLAKVSNEDEFICSQLMKTKVSSEEEERLLQEHMRLLTEKDAIVRRTEYFNVLEQLREVEDEIIKLQHELGSASNIDQDDKTEEDKQRIDKMMDDLVALVNKKDRLSQKLISHEAEDEEMGERDRLTLEAAANFSRGSDQPLSASKRLITWIRSEISS